MTDKDPLWGGRYASTLDIYLFLNTNLYFITEALVYVVCSGW